MHQIDDLNQFPLPSYRKVRPEDYDYIDVPSVIINGSRGCVRKCAYCDVAKYWPKFRFRSGDKLADEIFTIWQQTGVTKFEFSDSLINGSLREFRAMNRKLIDLKDKNPDFHINYQGQFICREATQFKEADYHDMKLAGCSYIYVGVESFSEQVRMSMDKKFDNNALEFHLEMCGRYLIPNTFLMIVGYPTETERDHEINLEGLKKYQKYSQSGIIEMITWGFTTAILEHTPLHAQMDELSIMPEFLDFNQSENWISLKNPGLTFRERVRRWLEVTDLSNQLGYNQTRLNSIINRLAQMLDQISVSKPNPKVIGITRHDCS
jgi:tRNA A37 methylthiotransferase MiaB